MVLHVCCKRLFPMFYLFFQTYVAKVSIWMLHIFIHMLQVFYLNVVYVCNDFKCFSDVFASVSDIFHLSLYVCCKCSICLHTYVASVTSRCLKNRLGIASPFSPSAVSPRCLLLVFCCLASFSGCGGGRWRVRAWDGFSITRAR
jgi:hypothetical protein